MGKQVLRELGEIAKKTAKDTAKAGGEIVKGTAEAVVGGGASVQHQGDASGQMERGQAGQATDPLQIARQQAAIKKRKGLQRVREELARYIEKKQGESKKEMVEERQAEIKKEQEEQKKESEREQIIRRAQRDYGGSREGSRKKH